MKEEKLEKQPSARVYIPNSGGGHDFSPAQKYGSLVYVSEGWLAPAKTGVILRLWEKALQGSSPQDYIVVTSLPVIFGIGAALFAERHKRLNLLLFVKEKYYIVRRLYL